jgi:Skp family chaperone for outer membrane proteins
MKTKTFLAATCVAAVSLAIGSQALAQAAKPAAAKPVAAAPVAAAAPSIVHGPAIPGVCVVSPEAAAGQSTVGKYVQTRLQQIATQVQAELTGEQTGIMTDAKALDGQKGTLDQASFDKRNADLQLRANAFDRKRQMREKELQATQQKALGRIGQELDPILRAAYQQNKCSMLLVRDAVLYTNPAMDLTPVVTTGLNAKITTFTFDREHLDQQVAPAQTSK